MNNVRFLLLTQLRFAAAESVEEHAVSRTVALIMLGTVGAACSGNDARRRALRRASLLR